MNARIKHHSSIALLALCATLPGLSQAAEFRVNSASDPASVNVTNCMTGQHACTLRDALAAADDAAGHDTITFDIKTPIYLTRKLVVQSPVTIDGGNDTVLRIHQGYQLVTLPDFRLQDDGTRLDVTVLQPTYYSENGFARVILELHGDGSEVVNLQINGGIEVPDHEAMVERIDYNSDGITDFFLNTFEGKRDRHWLVGGGIMANFADTYETGCGDDPTHGSVNISDNVLQHVGNTAIKVDFYAYSTISRNVISGGGVNSIRFDADGIEMYCGFGALVADNSISNYRDGISFNLGTAVTITGNVSSGNKKGIAFEGSSALVGPNSIERNTLMENLEYGLWAFNQSDTRIAHNEMTRNGSDPTMQGGMKLVGVSFNTIHKNQMNQNSGFGIVLDRSWYNELTENESNRNGGGGFILVNDAQHNSLQLNQSNSNGAGFITTITEGVTFPSNNAINNNTSSKNKQVDMWDPDPDCNDEWTDNQFKTAGSAAPGCIN